MSRPRRHNPPRWRRALRNLISASNQVFGVTAQRNRELAAAFVALPTFERESNLTLDRLTRFSDTTKPHVPGLARENAYQQPGAFDQLSTGLPVFDSRSCSNPNPAPPTSSIPDGLVSLIQQFVFRSTDRNVPAPACRQQSPFAGGTQFP